MAVSKRLRFEVLRRDGNTCRYCGAKPPAVALTVDHVVPTSLGGTDDPSNLVAACVPCNSGKSSSNPDAEFIAQVEEDAFQWKATLKDELRREVKDYPAVIAALAEFEEVWQSYTFDDTGYGVPMDSDWRATLKVWLNMLTQGNLEDPEFVQLALRVVLELVPVAMGRRKVDNRYRYFCGCVWNKVREMQGKLDVPEPPEPIIDPPPAHVLEFYDGWMVCSCGRADCVAIRDELQRKANPDGLEDSLADLHEITDDDGATSCACPDPFCSHLHAYRLRKGYL